MASPVRANPFVSLHVPETVPVGTEIRITMRIENRTREALDLYLTGRDTVCDVTAANASGDIVWRRLEGEVMQGILRLEVIQPGETLEFTETWDQRDRTGDLVTPGPYTLRGVILTDGSVTLQAEPVVLRIG